MASESLKNFAFAISAQKKMNRGKYSGKKFREAPEE
jgi:hypothetical protein